MSSKPHNADDGSLKNGQLFKTIFQQPWQMPGSSITKATLNMALEFPLLSLVILTEPFTSHLQKTVM